MYHANGQQKKAGVAILTSDNLDFIFLMFIYFWERQRQNASGLGAEREGDTEAEAEAGSRLWAVSTEPDAGLV